MRWDFQTKRQDADLIKLRGIETQRTAGRDRQPELEGPVQGNQIINEVFPMVTIGGKAAGEARALPNQAQPGRPAGLGKVIRPRHLSGFSPGGEMDDRRLSQSEEDG